MRNDWEDVKEPSEQCSESNGWCGWCGNCREHAEWIHERDRREEQEGWD